MYNYNYYYTKKPYYKIFKTEYGKKPGYISECRKRLIAVFETREPAYEAFIYFSQDANLAVNIEYSLLGSCESAPGGITYETRQLQEAILKEFYEQDQSRFKNRPLQKKEESLVL